MSFHIGQKVVCVTKRHINVGNLVKPKWRPVVGNVYTIRDIDKTYLESWGMVGLRLEEYVHELVRWKGGLIEPCWDPRRFRPAVATDISVFTAMLAPTPQRVAETASG